MSPVLIALLGVLLVPLFVTSWRIRLYGLALQGFLMAWVAYRLDPPNSFDGWLTLFDLVVVRGLWAPLAIYGVLRKRHATGPYDDVAPNLLSWTLALGIVLLAFNFSDQIVATASDDQRTLVAVAAIMILLALLVLATQPGEFSQVVGVLRIENGIALFAFGGTGYHPPIPVALAEVAVVAITIGVYRWYLGALTSTTPDVVPEPPSL